MVLNFRIELCYRIVVLNYGTEFSYWIMLSNCGIELRYWIMVLNYQFRKFIIFFSAAALKKMQVLKLSSRNSVHRNLKW